MCTTSVGKNMKKVPFRETALCVLQRLILSSKRAYKTMILLYHYVLTHTQIVYRTIFIYLAHLYSISSSSSYHAFVNFNFTPSHMEIPRVQILVILCWDDVCNFINFWPGWQS